MSLYDRVTAIQGGGRALAVARLRRSVLKSLQRAFQGSPVESQADLAKQLRVRRSAVNQVFRGDGNVRVSTLAEYLYEMGYELDITLVKSGELRAAALDDRRPIPAFTSASASAFLRFECSSNQPPWTVLTRIPSTPAALNILNFGVPAQILFQLALPSGGRDITSAVPVFESVDLSRDLINSGATP